MIMMEKKRLRRYSRSWTSNQQEAHTDRGYRVGAPGLINSREGVVINAVNLDWHDLKPGKPLEKKFSIPVSILNNSKNRSINSNQRRKYVTTYRSFTQTSPEPSIG